MYIKNIFRGVFSCIYQKKSVPLHENYAHMKTFFVIAGIIIGIAGIALAVLAHPAFGVFRHVSQDRLIQSPNWREGMFQNQEPTRQFTGDAGPGNIFRHFLAAGDTLRVPATPLPAYKTDLKTLPDSTDWVVWFGHSSYLFSIGGVRVLVDPVFRLEWPSTMMLRPFPGTDLYRPEDLPETDILVITHEHWDHMDYATLRDIRTKVRHVVCPLGIADYLRYWHYSDEQITEMDWGANHPLSIRHSDSISDGSLQVTCLPSRHFSNRLLLRRNRTLWASFMIENAGKRVYIGGDGGYDKRFKEIHEQFGTIDLAFLENGQYNANWRYIHTMPEDLEQAVLDLQAEQVFTVHHDKFALSIHDWREPDSVARSIAQKHHLRLLDAPIGQVVAY